MSDKEIYKTACELIKESFTWAAGCNGDSYYHYVDGIISMAYSLINNLAQNNSIMDKFLELHPDWSENE